MNSKLLERIIFHSKEDLSWAYNPKKAGHLLGKADIDAISDLNDHLDIYPGPVRPEENDPELFSHRLSTTNR